MTSTPPTHPLAGKPAPANLLVDLPKLITAYYTLRPDPSVAAQRVAFGTSGHRGVSFQSGFNEAHVLAMTQAICTYRKQQGISGPLFGYSDTWQLVINTSTTIITFLMVFLIQNAQNRDTHALQIKLDELIRVTEGAHSALMDLEELDEKELTRILRNYQKIAAEGRRRIKAGDEDTHVVA